MSAARTTGILIPATFSFSVSLSLRGIGIIFSMKRPKFRYTFSLVWCSDDRLTGEANALRKCHCDPAPIPYESNMLPSY